MNQPPAQQAPNLNVQGASSTAQNSAQASKYLDLARKIKEIEAENAKLAMKLEKSNQHLFRLKLEQNILMEKLNSVTGEKTTTTNSIKEEIINEMNQKIGQEDSEENI